VFGKEDAIKRRTTRRHTASTVLGTQTNGKWKTITSKEDDQEKRGPDNLEAGMGKRPQAEKEKTEIEPGRRSTDRRIWLIERRKCLNDKGTSTPQSMKTKTMGHVNGVNGESETQVFVFQIIVRDGSQGKWNHTQK